MKEFDALDMPSEVIEFAMAEASASGLTNVIKYSTADLNTIELPTDRNDIVFEKMSLHHIANLEYLKKPKRS